jgi:MerR family transcriptional regulator, light-induced transcriptional regulator
MGCYKIKDIEVLTGIKAHTIRIWEQRYGILVPERTDTKIRTYSDSDLRILLNVSLLNNSGLKISKIAKMSIDEIQKECSEISIETSLDLAIDRFITSLIEMDEHLFRNVLAALVKEKGILRVFSEDLVPFLDRIGVMWLTGSINPAQEHFISNLIRQKIISETELLPTPTDKSKAVLLYLPEHELHELGLLVYNYSIRKQGVFTYYLGQSVPLDSLFECIETLQPTHIVSSWLSNVEKKFLKDYFESLVKNTSVQILAGGYQVSSYTNLIPKQVTQFKDVDDLMRLILN